MKVAGNYSEGAKDRLLPAHCSSILSVVVSDVRLPWPLRRHLRESGNDMIIIADNGDRIVGTLIVWSLTLRSRRFRCSTLLTLISDGGIRPHDSVWRSAVHHDFGLIR